MDGDAGGIAAGYSCVSHRARRAGSLARAARACRARASVVAAAIAITASLLVAGCAAPGGPNLDAALTIERQGSFFVGGRTIVSETLSTLPAYMPKGTISVEQMYVRFQVPAGEKRAPVVFIHGCCLTGKTWETTPDGRMGWDEYFVRSGHPTYVVDQVARGRSAGNIVAINAVRMGKLPVDQLPTVFSVGAEDAWMIFRFGPEHPKQFPGMKFPLQAAGELWKQTVPDWIQSMPTPNPTTAALSELAQRLNGAVLISHSQSGIYPFQTAIRSRAGIAGIVSIEPGACPAAEGDMTPYKGMPILVLWGDFVDQSPRWAPRLKACREFVRAASAAGARAENVVLPEIGIAGNSHMLMQDSNSLEIARWLAAWLAKNVGR